MKMRGQMKFELISGMSNLKNMLRFLATSLACNKISVKNCRYMQHNMYDGWNMVGCSNIFAFVFHHQSDVE